MKRAITIILLSIFSLVLGVQTVNADHLMEPEGSVILFVTGDLNHENGSGGASFDRKMLESLPQHQFRTQTPWTDGEHLYEGVLLSELFEFIGAQGSQVKASALNDYHSVIDLDSIKDYPVLLAMKSDGKPMLIRDKGPIWILYPMSEFPELNNSIHHTSMVWQLNRLEVK